MRLRRTPYMLHHVPTSPVRRYSLRIADSRLFCRIDLKRQQQALLPAVDAQMMCPKLRLQAACWPSPCMQTQPSRSHHHCGPFSRKQCRPVASSTQPWQPSIGSSFFSDQDGALPTPAANSNGSSSASGSGALPIAALDPFHVPVAVPVDSPEERKRLWMAAIKPPMYSVGFMPVLVGAAAAYSQGGAANGLRCAGLVLAAICIIAWLNLSNDAFDAQTGVDKSKRESVVNLTGKPGAVLLLANVFLVSGISLFVSLLAATGDARIPVMLAAAIACGYMYQGPPFRLSYKGLGEPLCFVSFGLLATPAFFLAMLGPATAATATTAAPIAAPATATAAAAAATAAVAMASATTPAATLPAVFTASLIASAPAGIPLAVWALATLVGVTTTTILFCSHFHQIEGDIAAGKQSPLVRLGLHRALVVLRLMVGMAYVLAVTASVSSVLPWSALLATTASVPAAGRLLRFAELNLEVPEKIAPLKKYAVIWHVVFCFALCAGLVVSRL